MHYIFRGSKGQLRGFLHFDEETLYYDAMDEWAGIIRNRIRSGSYIADPETQGTLIDMVDKAYRCMKNDSSGHTGFMGENLILIAEQILRSIPDARFLITGGYPEAERKIALFPSCLEKTPDVPISLLRFSFSERCRITHRDILGTLMSMGIRRDCIGDILPAEGSSDVLVLREIASYLEMNIDRIGRYRCECREISPGSILIPEKKTRLVHDTVASLRLDSVLSAAFKIPRESASRLIKSRKVTLNGRETLRSADGVDPDSTISCRGYGKCRFVSSDGMSKKGRIRITLERFL